MKRMTIITLMLIVLMAIIVNVLIDRFTAQLEEEKQLYIEEVGKEVIVNGDTLIITDYSLLNENFTLSNGTTVDLNFIKNQK